MNNNLRIRLAAVGQAANGGAVYRAGDAPGESVELTIGTELARKMPPIEAGGGIELTLAVAPAAAGSTRRIPPGEAGAGLTPEAIAA